MCSSVMIRTTYNTNIVTPNSMLYSEVIVMNVCKDFVFTLMKKELLNCYLKMLSASKEIIEI